MEDDEFIAIEHEFVEDQEAEAVLLDIGQPPSFDLPVVDEYFMVSDF